MSFPLAHQCFGFWIGIQHADLYETKSYWLVEHFGVYINSVSFSFVWCVGFTEDLQRAWQTACGKHTLDSIFVHLHGGGLDPVLVFVQADWKEKNPAILQALWVWTQPTLFCINQSSSSFSVQLARRNLQGAQSTLKRNCKQTSVGRWCKAG